MASRLGVVCDRAPEVNIDTTCLHQRFFLRRSVLRVSAFGGLRNSTASSNDIVGSLLSYDPLPPIALRRGRGRVSISNWTSQSTSQCKNLSRIREDSSEKAPINIVCPNQHKKTIHTVAFALTFLATSLRHQSCGTISTISLGDRPSRKRLPTNSARR